MSVTRFLNFGKRFSNTGADLEGAKPAPTHPFAGAAVDLDNTAEPRV